MGILQSVSQEEKLLGSFADVNDNGLYQNHITAGIIQRYYSFDHASFHYCMNLSSIFSVDAIPLVLCVCFEEHCLPIWYEPSRLVEESDERCCQNKERNWGMNQSFITHVMTFLM
jgi:hypothetical protein